MLVFMVKKRLNYLFGWNRNLNNKYKYAQYIYLIYYIRCIFIFDNYWLYC